MQDRPYQQILESQIFASWQGGNRDVLLCLPCGGGKTYIQSRIVQQFNQPTAIVAHRNELVSQLSLSLANLGIKHGLVASKKSIKNITHRHYDKYRRSFYDPESLIKVGSIKTYLSRQKFLEPWARHVRLWVQDEAHHVLKENQWGKGRELFPSAYGLGLTATPTRTDGKGLGRNWNGIFDSLIEGPTMRQLINAGYLSDYRLITPINDLDLSDVGINNAGEFQRDGLRTAIQRSRVVGDVVEKYIEYAHNKLAVCFADSIENGTAIARRFNDAGIRAEIIHGNTDENLRYNLLERFERREIKVIVNVDLFGEGTDIPAIECVIMARPTMSLGLYIQQFGRALRLMLDNPGKIGIIIDHVENYVRHNLPDSIRVWSLEGRTGGRRRARDPDLIPLRVCLNCFEPYQAHLVACSHCGHRPEPASRSMVQHVDGDLIELDAETLRKMRGEIDRIDQPATAMENWMLQHGYSEPIAKRTGINHRKRQLAQGELREVIAYWGGVQRHKGMSDQEIYRLFYIKFGMDMMSAQALNTSDAMKLKEKIQNDNNSGMVRPVEFAAASVI